MVCGAGYYADDLGVCQKCTSNCIGCNKNECYSCDYGYGLINKVCVQCANKGCLICDNDANVCS